jgi:hypothetical protein
MPVHHSLIRRRIKGHRHALVSAAAVFVVLAGCADKSTSPDGPPLTTSAPSGAGAALQLNAEWNVAGYWSFDAQSDAGAEDSGKSAKAQLANASWTNSGRSGGALYFNGTTSTVTIADGAWNAGSPVTYNIWYKSEGTARGHLLEHEFGSKRAGAFSVDAGTAKFRAFYDSTRKSRDSSFGTATSNSWEMLTVVLDSGNVRLFRNGVSVFEAGRALPKLAGALRVGSAGANQNPFRGWIDEVAVFKRALTPAQVSEVHALYAPAAPPGGGSGVAGLLARWTFDDGTANDVSGHGNHGEISGATLEDKGRFRKALHFDGKSYVRVPDGAWNQAAPVTYNAWIKPEGEPYGFVFDHHVGWQAGGSFALINEAKKELKFLAFDDAANAVEVIGEGVASETWTMLTVVFTGTEVRLYRNGTLWETLAKKGLPRIEGDLYLGASENAKWGFFTGLIDEVSIYGRALTDAEVGTLTGDPICCGTVPGPDVARPGPAETFPELASQTAAVVEGTVRTIDYAYTDRQGPYTVVTLGDVTAHMGSAPSAIAIRQFGGPLPNGRGLRVSHQTTFVNGKRYIVFLRNTSWNFSPVVALNAFRVETVEGRGLRLACGAREASAVGCSASRARGGEPLSGSVRQAKG